MRRHCCVASRHCWTPAGGLRPGEGWARDGISWTPATLLIAQAWAACEQADRSERLLTWVAEHRTAMGAIPEKVTFDARPFEVAPLAWSCALAMLTGERLSRLVSPR